MRNIWASRSAASRADYGERHRVLGLGDDDDADRVPRRLRVKHLLADGPLRGRKLAQQGVLEEAELAAAHVHGAPLQNVHR